jgi:hypothetical protein
LEGFEDVFDFRGTDVGRGKVNSVWFHKGKVKLRVGDTVSSGDG